MQLGRFTLGSEENNMEHTRVTNETDSKIVAWKNAHRRYERAEQELSAARTMCMNTTNELGKWLMPPDAAIDEKFSIWYGDSIITATMVTKSDFQVHLRYQGKEWNKI